MIRALACGGFFALIALAGLSLAAPLAAGPAQAPFGFSVKSVGSEDERIPPLLPISRAKQVPWLGAKRSLASNTDDTGALSPERARILLRSLTVPGWGQAQLGHRTAASVFGLAEVGVWTAFTAFSIQHHLRTESYERTARYQAGIQIDGRDEEFRRIVGSFISSDEYNQLVVYRDAANLYYDDPVRYRQYIEQNELKGKDSWSWESEEALLRYQGQRKSAQRVQRRANTMLAVAVVNRLLSALHAARLGHVDEPTASRGWQIEVTPAGGEDPADFRLGVRTTF